MRVAVDCRFKKDIFTFLISFANASSLFRYGKNVPLKRAIRTICDMIIECFDDTIMRILCVAAVFSMGIGIYKDGWSHGWIDGTSIIIAVCIIVIVTVANNWVKEKQFQELQSKSDVMTARVIRNG